MLRAGLGISTLLDSKKAGQEAAERASARLGGGDGPELAVVFASAAHGRGLARVVHAARDAVAAPVVGGSVEGIVAADIEVSAYPAVLVLALSGAEVEPFFVHDLAGEEARAGEEIVARVGPPGQGDLVALLADSHSLDVGTLARGLGALRPATVIGTGAAAAPRGRPLLWCGAELASDGVAGWIMRGVGLRLAITQAGRAVTPLIRVSRARGNWVLGLGGRPALEVYLETARGRGLQSGAEAVPPLLLGLAGRCGASEELLVRNVVGFDPDRQAFSAPEPMHSGQEVALVELDAASAASAFVAQLESLAAQAPALGLYLNCRARGVSLFGEAGVEATHLANAFADLPIAGVSGPLQIAPMAPGETPQVLTYAGALALID